VSNIESERNTIERRLALLEKNAGRVCLVPFVRFDVWEDGSVPVCCTDWMQGDVIIGNVFRNNAEEIWNSPTAKKIRESVTDGSFRQCTEKCPLLAEGRLPLLKDLSWEDRTLISNPKGEMIHKPQFIKIVNDDSCNLTCPSCRNAPFVNTIEKSEQIFEANMRVIYPMLKNAKTLDILGNGEFLASKATLKLLKCLDARTHKNLSIDLLTNGMHFNALAWERLNNIHPLKINLNVSTDGVNKSTFEFLRRGGRWDVFNENMRFISRLRQEGKISKLTMNFTIQAQNYREMPLFGDYARQFNADRVLILRFMRWPHMTDEYFNSSNVYYTLHPDHEDFLSVVRGLSDEILELGPLSVFK